MAAAAARKRAGHSALAQKLLKECAIDQVSGGPASSCLWLGGFSPCLLQPPLRAAVPEDCLLLLLLSTRTPPDDASPHTTSKHAHPFPSGQADIMFCRGQDGNLVQLGAGAYGQVYKAFLNGLHPVAVKVFQTQVCVCV